MPGGMTQDMMQKQPFADVLQNKCSKKNLQYSQENTWAGVSF